MTIDRRTATLLIPAILLGVAACSTDSPAAQEDVAAPTDDTVQTPPATDETDATATTDAPAAPPPPTSGAPSDEVEVASSDSPTAACPTEGEEWEEAKLYIEHNATDEDTGVHGLFGGEAWSELCIWDPDGREVFVVDPLDRLDALTVADFFFESREPPNDEYAVEDLLADFPEGEYRVAGTDFEGTPRVGAARFTHSIPAEPDIIAPVLADDAETAGDSVVAQTGLVIEWEPVTTTIFGEPVEISGYEVIVTQEEWDDPDGLSRPIYDVHVTADTTSLAVPDGWLAPDTVYEIEVLALEVSGNQTIALGFVATE